MTSPDTINETINMLRRRVLEIDRQIEHLERQRSAMRIMPRITRCVPSRRSIPRPQPPDSGRISA